MGVERTVRRTAHLAGDGAEGTVAPNTSPLSPLLCEMHALWHLLPGLADRTAGAHAAWDAEGDTELDNMPV